MHYFAAPFLEYEEGEGTWYVICCIEVQHYKNTKEKNYDILDVMNMKFFALKSFIEVPNYQKLHIASS